MIHRHRHFASRHQTRACVGLLLCLWVTGCAKLARDFGEVAKLHAAIVKEFGEKDVRVNLNNDTVLTVSFINSPLNDKTADERTQRAEQTAAFVKDHYASISKMEAIWVSFVRAKTEFIFVNRVEMVAIFAFDKHGQLQRLPEEEPTDQYADRTTPIARYSETLKQTDVVIEHLQLEGDANFGMSVLVHFTVPGNATKLKRSTSYPEFVSFDFTSFSEKSMFPGEPKIGALVDGKIVFQTAGQFSTSKSPDTDQFNETLLLPIPYKAFQRMVTEKKLTLLIGDRAYEFTGKQLDALREMTEYVKD